MQLNCFACIILKGNEMAKNPILRRKLFQVPMAFFLLLIALRVTLQPIVHKELNKFLGDFSPTVSFYIGELDLDIFRGAYTFQKVTGTMRDHRHSFLKINEIDVSLAWRELLRGKVKTDIIVNGADFSYTKEVLGALKNMTKEKDTALSAKEKLFPVKIEKVEINDSHLTFDDYPGLSEKSKFKISAINGLIKNLTPVKENPFSDFFLTAKLPGNTTALTDGRLALLERPIEWNVDTELKGFDLAASNQFLKRKVPLTFNKGTLDLFAEARSKKGITKGYVKPFIDNLDVMKPQEDFKGPKHWLIEAATAIGNFILRAPDTKSLATKVPFSFDKSGFHVDSSEALSKVIEHGFDEKLPRGLENSYDLK